MSDGEPHSADRAAIAEIVPADGGRQLQAGSTRPTVKVGPHTGGRLIGVLESEVRPGGGFPAHVHEIYEEVFYVLDGEIEYLIDGTWSTAPIGSTVFVPPGQVHAFRNISDKPARHLAITSPADAMTMIEDAARAAPEQLADVLARYRSRLVPTRE